MFHLFPTEEEQGFAWESIGNVMDGRKNLGESMPVFVYRLFRGTVRDELIRHCGHEAAADIIRAAGETAGREFALHLLDLSLPLHGFMAHLQDVMKENKIGILRMESFDPATGRAMLTISEDLDCSGMPVTGETVCNYDEGFLAGILKAYTKKDYVVTEIDCWATGSRVCRFEAKRKDAETADHV